MSKPYEIEIEGTKYKVIDKKDGNDTRQHRLLEGGKKLVFQPELPCNALKLQKISKLKFTGKEWLIDGRNLKAAIGSAAGDRRKDSEARTWWETLWLLQEKLEEIRDEIGPIIGVAWFEDHYDEVDEETVEDCEQRREVLNLDSISPLPAAKAFKPVLLTDFDIVTSIAKSGQMAAVVMSERYEAVIEGEKRRVISFDEAGKILFLDKGQRYAFERLAFNAPGGREEGPCGDIFGWELLEAVRLQLWQGDWKWNDEDKMLCAWIEAQFKVQNKHPDSFEYFKRAVVKATLNGIRAALQEQIRGVAWFKHDDGQDGWNTPVLLSKFRLVRQSAATVWHPVQKRPQHEIEHEKTTSQFDNDFTIALIQSNNGKVKRLGVEAELSELIKAIVSAGGKIKRQAIIKHFKNTTKANSENYQPEKLLRSITAKALIDAGLLGSEKAGRTTVFWAKQKSA